jgi:hypothetical protein
MSHYLKFSIHLELLAGRKTFFRNIHQFFNVDDVLSTDNWTFIFPSISGDPEHKVPVLDPLNIEELRVNMKSIRFSLRNATMTGLKDIALQNIR